MGPRVPRPVRLPSAGRAAHDPGGPDDAGMVTVEAAIANAWSNELQAVSVH